MSMKPCKGKMSYMSPLMGLEIMKGIHSYEHNVPNGTFQTCSKT